MEELKVILGEEGYAELEAKIKAYNDGVTEDKDIINLKNVNGKYVNKDKAARESEKMVAENTELKEKVELLEKQKKETDKLIKNLDAAQAENAELKSNMDKLNTTYTEELKALENSKVEFIKTSTLREAIVNAGGAKNVDVLLAYLRSTGDFEKITQDKDGNLIGVNEIVGGIKGSEGMAHLFVNEPAAQGPKDAGVQAQVQERTLEIPKWSTRD